MKVRHTIRSCPICFKPDRKFSMLGAAQDGIFLHAVLMHVPDADLFESVLSLRDALRPGGSLVVSVSTIRDDIDIEEDPDTKGRLMVIRPVDRIQLLFERLSFSLESQWESADRLRRSGVQWVTRRDAVLFYWEMLRECHRNRFDREAGKLMGRISDSNWETKLFSVFVEAVETTAVKRGAERWPANP